MHRTTPSLASIFCGGLLVLCCPLPGTAAAPQKAATFQLSVSNPLDAPRAAEVLDLPLADIARRTAAGPASLVVREHATGKRLLTQVYNSNLAGTPDRFLILVDLAPKETKLLDVLSDPGAPALETRVTARQVPERKDDFAWENDKVAFRVYGPALEATGEIASGIDVWSKRVPDFITTSFYRRDEESARQHNPALSYHRDNGQGMDSYEVGASRGDGGTGVWVDGQLVASKNVSASTILALGPIRTDFIFHYAPWSAGGVMVDEVKRITLDAGSHLNHFRSTFTFEGGSPLTVAAGLAIHDGADVDAAHPDSAVSVWDTPQLAVAGRIATGMVLPPAEHAAFQQIPPAGKVDGNALLLFQIKSGDSIDYFAGAGWSLGDMPNFAAWNAYLHDVRERLEHPVAVKWLGPGRK